MGSDGDQGNYIGRSDPPISGAIFMASHSTKKECLKRKLFGLPPPQINFVKKVKCGMILFLFEFEERKLYGVFQATCDGAMGIVPHAYAGKFPAQIRMESMWNCEPLYECDFRDAIIENYYTANKFNFGLSKSQVSKLLLLFGSRRMKIQKFSPLVSERLLREKCMSRSGTRDHYRIGFRADERTPSYRGRKRDEHTSIHAVDNETVNVDRYPGISLSNISRMSYECIVEKNHLIFGGQVLPSPEQFREPQLSPYPKDAIDGLFPSSKTEFIPFHIEAESTSPIPLRPVRSVSADVTTNLGDFIPLNNGNQSDPDKSSMMPIQTACQYPAELQHEGSPCLNYRKDEHTGLRSDLENERVSVFSRLKDRKEGDTKVDCDLLGTNGNNVSLDEFMDEPNQYQRQCGRITKKFEYKAELGDVDQCAIPALNKCEDATLDSEEELCFEESSMNFKRRSKTRKMQNELNGHIEETNRLSGSMLPKRRKLSRPSFNREGTDYKVLTADSCPNVDHTLVSSDEGEGHAKDRSPNFCLEIVVEHNCRKAETFEDHGENKEALVGENVGESCDNSEKEVAEKYSLQVVHHSDSFGYDTVQTVICSDKGLNSDENKPGQKSDDQVALHCVCSDQSCGEIARMSNSQDFQFQVKSYIQELDDLKEYDPSSCENPYEWNSTPVAAYESSELRRIAATWLSL